MPLMDGVSTCKVGCTCPDLVEGNSWRCWVFWQYAQRDCVKDIEQQ